MTILIRIRFHFFFFFFLENFNKIKYLQDRYFQKIFGFLFIEIGEIRNDVRR